MPRVPRTHQAPHSASSRERPARHSAGNQERQARHPAGTRERRARHPGGTRERRHLAGFDQQRKVVIVSLLAGLLCGATPPTKAIGKVPAPAWLLPGDRDKPVGEGELAFGWHGTATIEVRSAKATLLIDPFYTRYSALYLVSNPVISDPAILDKYARRPDAIFVNHSHFDHFLDAPALARKYQVPVYLPEDAVGIARAENVPEGLIRVLKGGEQVTIGDMTVDVVAARHPAVITQLLVGGEMRQHPKLPLWYNDYRTEQAMDFVIGHGGLSIAHIDAPDSLDGPIAGGKADVVLASIALWYRRPQIFDRIRKALAPKVLVPMHIDDFTLPLEAPMVVNVAAHVEHAIPEIERDLPGTAIVPFSGFFQEFRIAGPPPK
ncbi:MAG: MBL fold metallo-hydrolase [Candidatus Sericytochromatia bacterium]|uniref:MBL fold metallo-hydrolase n=1 Tax=Candidatus Tanganyikabacteria bacterium TaxID=2961651 RepID=A0A937X0X0_9BACT|nr:MBL fold metallo-hydrolase [Candidatus Tanganyikabacteria bacterium]